MSAVCILIWDVNKPSVIGRATTTATGNSKRFIVGEEDEREQ